MTFYTIYKKKTQKNPHTDTHKTPKLSENSKVARYKIDISKLILLLNGSNEQLDNENI